MINIPDHLIGANLLTPPEVVQEFCKQYDVQIAFVDDKERCKNSVRSFNCIYINVRGTFWANYIYPPWGAKTFGETIAIRLLHEVGHAVSNHKGSAIFGSDGALVRTNQDYWQATLSGNEGEAWTFAFDLRRDYSEIYQTLVIACEEFVLNHTYSERDWKSTAEEQWRLKFNCNLTEYDFKIPKWVWDNYKDRLRYHGNLTCY